MTKRQAEKFFRALCMPMIQNHYEKDWIKDTPARREAWNVFTDSLCKDGEITQKQYNTWGYPSWL